MSLHVSSQGFNLHETKGELNDVFLDVCTADRPQSFSFSCGRHRVANDRSMRIEYERSPRSRPSYENRRSNIPDVLHAKTIVPPVYDCHCVILQWFTTLYIHVRSRFIKRSFRQMIHLTSLAHLQEKVEVNFSMKTMDGLPGKIIQIILFVVNTGIVIPFWNIGSRRNFNFFLFIVCSSILRFVEFPF